MKIHTSLTRAELLETTRGLPVSFHTLTEHRSTTHARSFDVRLEGTGGRSNTGLYGAGNHSGATWDEWGAWMGRVFRLDPAARMGGTVKAPTYADAIDFHWQTGDRFIDGGMPTDTHPRHGWGLQGRSITGAYTVRECGKCGAISRAIAYGHDRSEVFA